MQDAHHYTECGLMNVYISGIAIEIDDDGDEIVTIPGIHALHKIIAIGIVSHPKGISSDELRFLRSEMGLTQAELADLVHRDKQSIGRWERGEVEIDSASETLIRRMAIEKLTLPVDLGIDELSRRSVPTASRQVIAIRRAEHDHYELMAA